MARNAGPKKLFVAATQQDQGKTTVSLGLMRVFEPLCGPVGFIKPVGQRYVEIEGVRVDEDVALMRAIFRGVCDLSDVSPVTIGRTFTRDYIAEPRPSELADRILGSFRRVAEGMSLVIIEGTGHAGVGSCFDMSNADVARLLGAKVVLVTGGGVGRPIDEILLNQSLFRERGVELVGAILNKVLPAKLESIREIVQKGLARKGLELLGCIPHMPLLEHPTIRQVLDEIGGELLNGQSALAGSIRAVIVGAMTAHRALEYISPYGLVITPGDRDDLILAALSGSLIGTGGEGPIAGIVLTGGITPNENILKMIRRTEIPVILVEEDTYSTAAAFHALSVKIQPSDQEKIHTVPHLIRRYVDVERILERL